jgi:Trypsin
MLGVRMPSPLRTTALIACGCALIACNDAPTPTSSTTAPAWITEGTLDESDEAVVAIGFRRVLCGDQFLPTCTGTLVAPRVVLTAAHCVDRRIPLEVFFGTDVSKDGVFVGVVSATPHPSFDDEDNANDVALLLLDRVAPAEPIPMVDEALDGAFMGTQARIVGFGHTAAGADDAGLKMEGTSDISVVTPDVFEIVPGPSMTCHVDSGGPVFVTVEGQERLAGVTSSGDLQCASVGVNTQVGAHLASFIDPFLSTVGEVGDAGGAVALSSVCEEDCGDDEDCPLGMTCERGMSDSRCMLAPLPPGAFEGNCERDEDCTGQCARVPGESTCLCHSPCEGSVIPPPVDAGREGGKETGLEVVDYHAGGGCVVCRRANRSSLGWGLLLLAVCALGVRRRTQT